jgi:hypothetical protein
MKYKLIVAACEDCPRIIFNALMEKICDLYPDPAWIWETRDYCPVKNRSIEKDRNINE